MQLAAVCEDGNDMLAGTCTARNGLSWYIVDVGSLAGAPACSALQDICPNLRSCTGFWSSKGAVLLLAGG